MEYGFSIATHRGELPTEEQIEKLFEQKPTHIQIMDGWHDYEENITFNHLQITFVDGQQLNVSGYCGMWELMHPEKLNEANYNKLVRDLKDWILDEFTYNRDDNTLELWSNKKDEG